MIPRLVLASLVLFQTSCSVDSYKKRYILAEKLWADGKYAASVIEFENVARRDPDGQYGIQSLFRGAMTQSLFLGQHVEAIEKFKLYANKAKDPELAWEARKEIGEILFNRIGRYARAADHFEGMLKDRPSTDDTPELLFRLGKSKFYLWKFNEAVEIFSRIHGQYPDSSWAEEALYEIGVSYFTGGEQQPGGSGPGMEIYQKSIQAYETFVKKFPKSKKVPQAKFGIAACYEELDQLEEAHQRFMELRDNYPSPEVIDVKLARIQDRITQKNRSL